MKITKLLLCTLICVWPVSSIATESSIRQTAGEATKPLEKTSKSRRLKNWVMMPVPISNPTIGTGLAVGAMRLYKLGEDAPASTVTFGGMWADSKSWAGGAYTRNYLKNDKLRINGGVGYANVNLKFFGIGGSAGRLGLSIPINQKGTFAVLDALWQVRPNFYTGLRFRYLDATTNLQFPGTEDPNSFEFFDGLKVVSSGPGVNMEWDTRDDAMYPSSGSYATFVVDSSMGSFGGDRDYLRGDLNYRKYHSFSERRVLALQLTGCVAGGNAPFYDICLLGSNKNLRGTVSGRYRDERMLTTQLEYRHRFGGKLGMVVFAGAGAVAKTLSDFGSSRIVPGYGLGIRYMVSEEHHVNASIDYAWGDDDSALYFYIGESF